MISRELRAKRGLHRQRPWGALWRASVALGAVFGLLACDRREAPAPLGPDEEALVQAYVRLTVVQALQESAPDSATQALGVLRAHVDSLAVQRALAGLSQDPLRWEQVYGEIASRLEDLEATPSLWLKVARGESVSVPAAPEPASSGRIRAPGR